MCARATQRGPADYAEVLEVYARRLTALPVACRSAAPLHCVAESLLPPLAAVPPCRPDGSRPEIYLKREDLNHTGAHKINNSLGQALLCKRMGKKRIIAETGAGQHGVATVRRHSRAARCMLPASLAAPTHKRHGHIAWCAPCARAECACRLLPSGVRTP